MSNNVVDKEEKFAKSFLRKCPFIKNMWREREKAYKIAYKKETIIEKKYNKIAKKAGLKSVKFAYNEYCFGIDINDVDAHGTNLKQNRLLIHDMTLE
ncbi:MAG: hypothetical protein ISS45_12920 [Candidatus Omnitrophica bacterium]|nr:hypothetical protein [Candidatus Omnitrophota bacterium]